MLRNLILSAAAAGLAAGLVTAAIQHVTTTPIIIEAEKYESGTAAPGHDHSSLPASVSTAVHSHQATGAADAVAGASDGEWNPRGGTERALYTSLATMVVGVGFALVLLGTMAFAGVPIHARTGLAFGAAGFAAVALAPALGLPPEMPGSGVAAFEARQIWWFATVAATALGLAGLLLTRSLALQVGGVALIALPHILGAPRPDALVSTAPAELAAHFAATSLGVTAIFWAVLGFASGGFYERIARSR